MRLLNFILRQLNFILRLKNFILRLRNFILRQLHNDFPLLQNDFPLLQYDLLLLNYYCLWNFLSKFWSVPYNSPLAGKPNNYILNIAHLPCVEGVTVPSFWASPSFEYSINSLFIANPYYIFHIGLLKKSIHSLHIKHRFCLRNLLPSF